MGLQQPITCKMVKVQRSFPCREVEPQANGGRKIPHPIQRMNI